MTIIELNKRFYTIPTSWNELSRRQLLQVMKVFYSTIDAQAALLRLLKILTGMSWFRFFRCSAAELEEFIYLTGFLLKENELSHQLIPVYRKYHGPAGDFNNLVMAEFVFTQDYYLRFCDSKKEDMEALDHLVACLYRPGKKNYDIKKNKDGDPRVEFNENICDHNSRKHIRRWPAHVKYAIFHWYDGCHARIMANLPQQSDGEPAKYGLLSVMRSIAEKGVHGDMEKVSKMYVKMWLMELHEMAEEVRLAKKAVSS